MFKKLSDQILILNVITDFCNYTCRYIILAKIYSVHDTCDLMTECDNSSNKKAEKKLPSTRKDPKVQAGITWWVTVFVFYMCVIVECLSLIPRPRRRRKIGLVVFICAYAMISWGTVYYTIVE